VPEYRSDRHAQRSRNSLLRRLVFAAKERCDCGAGFAYDKRSRMPRWDCSAILLGDALLGGESSVALHSNPCSFYEMVSERHAASHGQSTRPA
jgi:hypothetical protein